MRIIRKKNKQLRPSQLHPGANCAFVLKNTAIVSNSGTPGLRVPGVLRRGVSASPTPDPFSPITGVSVFAETHSSSSSYHTRAITFRKMLTFRFWSNSPASHAEGAGGQRHIWDQHGRPPGVTLSPWGERAWGAGERLGAGRTG